MLRFPMNRGERGVRTEILEIKILLSRRLEKGERKRR